MLKGCDIILALSENTINFQFEQLYKKNIIPKKWNAQDGSIESEFEAKIESPMISIIEDDRKKLNLEISFTSGTLSYWKGFGPAATRMIEDMKGWKYVFEVKLGLISHKADEFISRNTGSLTVTQEATTQVQDSIAGIPDKYFTIESLFIDFTNTNFTQYDASKSIILVEEPSALEAFQVSIFNYFKRLAETQNPYILGHSIKRVDYESQPAIFQPTSCNYSTSYDKNPGLSALNFLMMIDGREFAEAQDTGILPHSFISYEDPSIDGIFVLNYQYFKDNYINKHITPVIKNAVNQFMNNIRQIKIEMEDGWYSWEDCEIIGFDNINNIELKESDVCLWQANVNGSVKASISTVGFEISSTNKQDIDIDFDLLFESRKNNYLEFIFRVRIDIKYNYQAVIPGTMGNYEDGFMTNHAEKGGKEYKIHIKMLSGKHGKIKLETYCENGEFIENNMEKINSYMNSFGEKFRKGVESGYSIFELSINEITLTLESELQTISAQKTILPLGNLYTYKNIRLFDPDKKAKKPTDNAVCFDIAYAPLNKRIIRV